MKVLLLHPGDVPWGGLWARERWDLVVDFGFASRFTYEEWGRRVGSRVLSLHEFTGQTDSYCWVNRLLDLGRGRLFDRYGLDWWEILSMESHQDLQALYLVERLKPEIGADSLEVAATRSHPFNRIVEQALNSPVRCFRESGKGFVSHMLRAARSARNLRAAQIAEIAFDKWDPDHQLRRYWMKGSRAGLASPAVLLPSAYSNVTRSALAYAEQLPQRRFLLVTTRSSAVPGSLPENVTIAPLSAYVSRKDATQDEALEVKEAWQTLQDSLKRESDELRHAAEAGFWDYFPAHLEHGLHLRVAWQQVLDSEPITAVLCGDDLNYHTRLPLMLARRKDLQAIYCSHGALDGGFLFKKPMADVHLVKGEMERDYLHRVSGISGERILVGAPGKCANPEQPTEAGDALVFFSQPYEVAGGRTDAIYGELLPHLWSVSRRAGRKLVIKLHPFESTRARSALVKSILGTQAHAQVEIVDGGPPERIMSSAWSGVTVDSSVAVECALRAIPFFLCGWLDFMGMGYLPQYARFGVGHVLNSPEEIDQIPEVVARYRMDPEKLHRLRRQADPAQLDQVLSGTWQARLNSCAC